MNREANDQIIRSLAEKLQEMPDAQYTIYFKGRSLPATLGEVYESTDADGFTYLSIGFWDGDSGNLFDMDYRLLPEKILVNGKVLEF